MKLTRWFVVTLLSAVGVAAQPMRQIPITDSVLKMTAYTLNAPANWNADGAMVPNPSCAGGGPTPTYKVVSPDGLSGVFVPPRYDWAWGPAVPNQGDCLPLKQAMSAKDFLTYFIRIKQLGFVAEEPVPDAAEH
jgi:hypothetical protein